MLFRLTALLKLSFGLYFYLCFDSVAYSFFNWSQLWRLFIFLVQNLVIYLPIHPYLSFIKSNSAQSKKPRRYFFTCQVRKNYLSTSKDAEEKEISACWGAFCYNVLEISLAVYVSKAFKSILCPIYCVQSFSWRISLPGMYASQVELVVKTGWTIQET